MKSRLKQVVVLMALSTIGSVVNSQRADVGRGYYLFADPNSWDRRTNSPAPMRVYRLDSSLRHIQYVTDISVEGQVTTFGIFPRLGLLIFQVRSDSRNLVKEFRTDQRRTICLLDTSATTWLEPWRLYHSDAGQSQVEIRAAIFAKKNPGVLVSRVDCEGQALSARPTDAEAQLSDPGTYYGLQGNVVPVRLNLRGDIMVMDSTQIGPIGPLPHGTIKDSLTKDWNIIANEPLFRAILSVSNRKEQRNLELIVQNRLTNQWKSIPIEGSETRLKAVNGWLVGTAAQFSSKTDLTHFVAYPPTVTDKLIVVNPLSFDAFAIAAGKNCEALWVDSHSTLIYRRNDSLFTGRISSNGLNSVRLQLVDTLLRDVHWAIEAGVGPR